MQKPSIRVRVLILAQLLVTLLSCNAAWAQVKVGAMGDSYSDEYSVLSAGLYNWVDLLVVSGRANFGPLAAFPSGDPRNTGGLSSYTYNFAKGGAKAPAAPWEAPLSFPPSTTTTRSPAVPTGPISGRASAAPARRRRSSIASQEIGGNDMLDQIINHQKLLLGLDTGVMNPILGRFNQITDIATASYTSPLEMVLVKYPDLGSMPVFAGLPQLSQDSIRLNMQYFNANIDVQATAHGLATVDLFALWDNLRTAGGTTVHAINISPGSSTGGLLDLRSAWLSDGLHPTPIFQALWANEFIAAVNTTQGQSIAPLSPKEMVTLTGVDPQQNPTATTAQLSQLVGQDLLLSAPARPIPIRATSHSHLLLGPQRRRRLRRCHGRKSLVDLVAMPALGVGPAVVRRSFRGRQLRRRHDLGRGDVDGHRRTGRCQPRRPRGWWRLYGVGRSLSANGADLGDRGFHR